MHFANEVPEHGFGDFKVGDNAVFHGPDGDNVPRGAAQHHLGLPAYGQNFVAVPDVFAHRHHRGLAQNNPFAFDIH